MPFEILSFIFSAFFITYLQVWLAKPIAFKCGLVDRPNHRKLHEGSIPLVGGICVFIGISLSVVIFLPMTVEVVSYILLSGLMVTIGVVDDYKDISVKPRLLTQIAIALAMVFFLDYKLSSLGSLFTDTNIQLGYFSAVFTVLAVVGCINAFNMVDGIDGLVGVLSLIAFTALAFLLFRAGIQWYVLCVFYIGAIAAYLMFNLNWPIKKYKKIFMGDAGSMLIGFTIIWLLCIGTQSKEPALAPVTALWIIAVPLIDMAAIMIRRIRKGDSPFKPDREHLHHIFMRAGATPKQTLFLIAGLSLLMTCLGIYLEQVSETISLLVFLVVFFVYSYLITHIWKVLTFMRKLRKKTAE
ncbi:UDP-N-acetylglucosamine--undecaprenyl-phosphate N-acetylglucosaminephosphotransferase [Pseudoalteromonas sp. NCCP-2140]|uniref:UDP-N-acetylglucosamine--undecaprenyl-phosphate N-acetylglucosaminephosphotransferase n=1 Tax=Pseudoalteromonas sp. NCCP-2140 TaxID=2942288 RepID=UPI00203F4FD8|nr:UDP-N-acetylglucosamine--undecaprenyl-phosphate N-acetylglucosaminephosphotransferase [Pseudoalteromonas sp. NCCP-2140]